MYVEVWEIAVDAQVQEFSASVEGGARLSRSGRQTVRYQTSTKGQMNQSRRIEEGREDNAKT